MGNDLDTPPSCPCSAPCTLKAVRISLQYRLDGLAADARTPEFDFANRKRTVHCIQHRLHGSCLLAPRHDKFGEARLKFIIQLVERKEKIIHIRPDVVAAFVPTCRRAFKTVVVSFLRQLDQPFKAYGWMISHSFVLNSPESQMDGRVSACSFLMTSADSSSDSPLSWIKSSALRYPRTSSSSLSRMMPSPKTIILSNQAQIPPLIPLHEDNTPFEMHL